MNFQPLIDSLNKIFTDITGFIPKLINGLIIMLIGYLISILIRWIIGRVLRAIQLDQLADRTGISSAIRGLGVKVPLSNILTQVVFFFLILSFATASVRLMELAAVADLLDNVLKFIPNAISAALLIIFGSMLARFLGNTIAAVAETVNITYGAALGKVLEYAIVIFSAVLAISTLGLDTTLLTSSLTIIVASVGLAIALTFGLGSRDAASNVIAGYYVRQNFRPGQTITYGDVSGVVRFTRGAYTVVEIPAEGEAAKTVSLPNTLLLRNSSLAQEKSGNTESQPEN